MKLFYFVTLLSSKYLPFTSLIGSQFRPPSQMAQIQLRKCSTGNSSGNKGTTTAILLKEWNFKAIRGEILKQSNRILKKLEKPATAVAVDDKENDRSNLQSKLRLLNETEDQMSVIKSAKDLKFNETLLPLFIQLGLDNFNPPVVVQKVAKVKPPPVSPRKPYNVFTSAEGIEIWVGRQAADNDELSCNPQHRHNDEWWLHAAGSAGSHVVIKCTDDDLPTKYRETLLDAAYLATAKSKSAGNGAVSLTRCRNVSKPKGAKDGLVQLRGEILSVRINMASEKHRASRLVKKS